MGLLRSVELGRGGSWVDKPVSPFMKLEAKYWPTIVLGIQALGSMQKLNPLQYFFENRESQGNE